MTPTKQTDNTTKQLDQIRRTREALERKLERATQKERDIAIGSFLKNDKNYHKAEQLQVALRRKLHNIRQNLQKKQMSIEFQQRRIAETQQLHDEFVKAEKVHAKELEEVMAKIEEIKSGYAKRVNA